MVRNRGSPPLLWIEHQESAVQEAHGQEGLIFLKVVSLAEGNTIATVSASDKKSQILDIAWLPDGKTLAYLSLGGNPPTHVMWVWKLGDEVARRIADFGGEEISHFAVTQDGKGFALSQGTWRSDAILITGLR